MIDSHHQSTSQNGTFASTVRQFDWPILLTPWIHVVIVLVIFPMRLTIIFGCPQPMADARSSTGFKKDDINISEGKNRACLNHQMNASKKIPGISKPGTPLVVLLEVGDEDAAVHDVRHAAPVHRTRAPTGGADWGALDPQPWGGGQMPLVPRVLITTGMGGSLPETKHRATWTPRK